MRGDNHLLALTTTTDEVTNEVKPLFAFPVQVCKATSDNDPKFEVAAPSGAKRVQVFVDPISGEQVADEECPRGIFIGNEFKPVDKGAIDAIKAATKIETMVALDTIPLAGFRERYGDRIIGRYFLQNPAKGGSAVAYKLTYEALKAEQAAIVTKRTARSKQKLAVVYADEVEECLAMVELVFADAVRSADEQVKQPQTVTITEQQLGMARDVVKNKIGTGTGQALDTETDEAIAMKRDLMDKAINGETIDAPTPIASTVEAKSLEDLLAASLSAS